MSDDIHDLVRARALKAEFKEILEEEKTFCWNRFCHEYDAKTHDFQKMVAIFGEIRAIMRLLSKLERAADGR